MLQQLGQTLWTTLFDNGRGAFWYNIFRKWFTLGSLATAPQTLIINAPFGRFVPKDHSIFLLDGLKSWIVMELVAPVTFLLTFIGTPLALRTPQIPPLGSKEYFFVALYLIHYTNRAILSPLRTPRAQIIFNILNGFLLGAYFSSPYAHMRFASMSFTDPKFLVGITIFFLGMAGNITHDEILLNIRRKAKSKGKGKESTDSSKPKEEHYAIPQGLLYKYVSFPNYFCEWVEWFGFALASAPFPLTLTAASLSSLFNVAGWQQAFLGVITDPAYLFAPNLSPPYIFLLNEIVLMLPRAYKGHLWYKEKFGDRYPEERKAVIPFVL
ncbi:3-oxo-5-alpha-steroid 4-dehydrogenase-domain-containing protein [Cyathus striatus]|nr:3-oxo-5-alpha-steroid 4-dehydrogenase-domain-containing protein [Cyathus striatus]